MKKMSNESLQAFCNYGQFVAGIITAFLILGNFYFGNLVSEEKEKQKATSGEIIPKTKTEDNSVESLTDKSGDYVTVQIGSVSGSFPKQAFIDGFYASTVLITGAEPIKCKFANGKLLISVKVIDKDKKIICELSENEWTISTNNYFKRNYDDNAVEVIDQYGHVVVSAELENKNHITINGIFYTPNSGTLFASKRFMSQMPDLSPNATIEQKKQWDEKYQENAEQIKALFSYRGKDFLGKREVELKSK